MHARHKQGIIASRNVRNPDAETVITMADCELLATCPFFNDQMAEMPSMSSIIKERYCRGSNTMCARHMIFRVKGREAVPVDLYPSQVERADELLAER